MVDVVVVIATSMKRTNLLLKRSLRSVYQQQGIHPLCVYIIDDNEDKHEIGNIRQCVNLLREEMFGDKAKNQNFFHTKVMRNRRTKHQSGAGAWNTAAMHAYQVYGKQYRLYLALLDDDDAWYRGYLQQCVTHVEAPKTTVIAVVSSFLRIEPHQKQEVTIRQVDLDRLSFYKGNPGWQGSNTFVEIKAFWMAGGFDESMPSTHDRDFAIRIFKLCEHQGYQVVANENTSWDHYAHAEKRVTTSGRKHQGLSLFYYKYIHEMTSDTRELSLIRAKKLFQYEYKFETFIEKPEQLDAFCTNIFKHIIIGVVSSSVDNVKHQLQSILNQLDLEPEFSGGCSYIVIGNGNASQQDAIERLLKTYQDDRLEVQYVCLEQQQTMLKTFSFLDIYHKEDLSQKSIAFSRSLLQFKLWKEAKKYTARVVLVLDDDLLFESLCLDKSSVCRVSLNFFAKLMVLSEEKADIVISRYTDAPPLPFYSSLRVQLLDLVYRMQKEGDVKEGLVNQFGIRDDYYYDLSSSQYHYLEMPLSIHDKRRDIHESILQLGKQINTSRPLLFSALDWNKKLLRSDYHRGGIAIFNNIEMLVKVPHLSPEIEIRGEKKLSRRSDFISSVFLMEAFGANIQEACFPLRHNRSLQMPCSLGLTKMALDVFGAVFYRALIKSSQEGITDRRVKAYFDECIRDFITKLEVTGFRVFQLIHELMQLIEKSELTRKQELLESLEHVGQVYAEDVTDEQMRIIRRELQKFDIVCEISRMKKWLC